MSLTEYNTLMFMVVPPTNPLPSHPTHVIDFIAVIRVTRLLLLAGE